MWKRSPVPFLKEKRPLVMAHRGDSAHVPENTLKAIQDAISYRVDVVETDLRVTKDDEVLFFHDAMVNRTTNGRGFVRSFSLAEIKKLDQGYSYKGPEKEDPHPFRGKGLQIQTIEDILSKFPKTKFNMDIKDRFAKAPDILARKLKELDAEDRVMVGSFHHKQLERFRLKTGAPTSASPIEVFMFRQKIRKWIRKNPTYNYYQEMPLDQEEILGKALPYFALQVPEKFFLLNIFRGSKFFSVSHMLDIAIHVWTVNDPGDMFRLLDWGVDGIFTDNPRLLSEIVEFKLKKMKKK
ncbi:MAG: glycerophosphodiester phosphodiesterase [Candidatus Heimdallarchaeota archaeon]|nr:MAG: glycerophosphodiester phosphodiesterase [Candidatus Heimdallarchaeota archaeon]